MIVRQPEAGSEPGDWVGVDVVISNSAQKERESTSPSSIKEEFSPTTHLKINNDIVILPSWPLLSIFAGSA